MNIITFDQLPQAVSLLIGKVDALTQLLSTQETDPPSNDWMNIDQLRQYHPDRPAKQTVYQWLSAGKIPAHKKGKKVYFLKSEIDEWLAGGKRITKATAAAEANSFLSSPAQV